VLILGLPEIVVEFRKRAETMKSRSQRGIVALAFKDLVAKSMSYTFNSYDEVDQKGFSEKSLGYIKMAFRGNPYKVIVEIMDK